MVFLVIYIVLLSRFSGSLFTNVIFFVWNFNFFCFLGENIMEYHLFYSRGHPVYISWFICRRSWLSSNAWRSTLVFRRCFCRAGEYITTKTIYILHICFRFFRSHSLGICGSVFAVSDAFIKVEPKFEDDIYQILSYKLSYLFFEQCTTTVGFTVWCLGTVWVMKRANKYFVFCRNPWKYVCRCN